MKKIFCDYCLEEVLTSVDSYPLYGRTVKLKHNDGSTHSFALTVGYENKTFTDIDICSTCVSKLFAMGDERHHAMPAEDHSNCKKELNALRDAFDTVNKVVLNGDITIEELRKTNTKLAEANIKFKENNDTLTNIQLNLNQTIAYQKDRLFNYDNLAAGILYSIKAFDQVKDATNSIDWLITLNKHLEQIKATLKKA